MGPITHRGGGVAFTTGITRRHECERQRGVLGPEGGLSDWPASFIGAAKGGAGYVGSLGSAESGKHGVGNFDFALDVTVPG